MKLRTWHVEAVVVATVLASVVLISRGRAVEWIAAAAVCVSFMHGQVTTRLAEREAARATPQVTCHAWTGRYYVAKEALWLVYFLAVHAWSALVGVGLFLLYPRWRAWWRARHPLDRPVQDDLVDALAGLPSASHDRDIAARFGVSRSTITRWRTGITAPAPALLPTVLAYLATLTEDGHE